MLDKLLERVAIVGAAGKMGRGISLLLLQEMARLEATTCGQVGSGRYRLVLINAEEEPLQTMHSYLKPLIQKWAERNINELRTAYKDIPSLIDNGEIIEAFVDGAMNIVHLTTDLNEAKGASLVFEAIPEDLDLKIGVFQALQRLQSNQPVHYLTNTSSIPIQFLNQEAKLNNRLVGFHFYNPPPVQPLVELITDDATSETTALSVELGSRLGKMLVPSADVAGFIGNGHFLREIAFACEQVAALSSNNGQEGAICALDKVTKDFLIRPMGIFQLIDYVGLDVAKKICGIMNRFVPNLKLKCDLIHQYVDAGILGGQRGDGSQKDGFFQYKDGVPIAVFNLQSKAYQPLEDLNKTLGNCPQGCLPWKAVVKDRDKQEILKKYFQNLFADQCLGSQLAQTFLRKSRFFAEELVREGVAKSGEDVNRVLQNGFSHAYGPINTFY